MTGAEAIARMESMCQPSLRVESAIIVRADVEAIRVVLAQIEAGRTLAGAAREIPKRLLQHDANCRDLSATACLCGATEADLELYAALAAWDRAVGEGGAK